MSKRYKTPAFLRITHLETTRQISPNVAARITGRSLKTIHRWIDGTQKPDPASLQLLRIHAFGLLPLLEVGPWSGFSFKQEGFDDKSQPVLVTPYNMELTAGQINGLIEAYRLIDCQKVKISRLEREIKEVTAPSNVIAFAPYLRRAEYDRHWRNGA